MIDAWDEVYEGHATGDNGALSLHREGRAALLELTKGTGVLLMKLAVCSQMDYVKKICECVSAMNNDAMIICVARTKLSVSCLPNLAYLIAPLRLLRLIHRCLFDSAVMRQKMYSNNGCMSLCPYIRQYLFKFI